MRPRIADVPGSLTGAVIVGAPGFAGGFWAPCGRAAISSQHEASTTIAGVSRTGRPALLWSIKVYDSWSAMSKLKSEFEVGCPCCRSTLVVDTNLRRVVRHTEPERADKPELDRAHDILRAEEQRREARFAESWLNESTKGDALEKRFEEALKQAKTEPITKPQRDFDLD